ncbi:hypothetical protein LLY39_01890 [Flavobacterium anhuiense]|nr:transcription termination/antitermination NusG family protein [Flavobacterium anhuiense]URM37362.1 hypothetical protein LLY39_01890 [Flavobacterium anhuiense]
MNWYVVYTKPKWEKKVADKLNQLGIECYCPLITQIKQWSDRKKRLKLRFLILMFLFNWKIQTGI